MAVCLVSDISALMAAKASATEVVAAVVRFQLSSLLRSAVAAGVLPRDFAEMVHEQVRPLIEESARASYVAPDEGLAYLLKAEGGCVNVSTARKLFRKPNPVTRQAISERIRKGELVAYRTGGGQYVLPKWQFRREGGVIEGLPEVLAAIRQTIPAASQLTPFAFLLQADPVTGNRPPLEALRQGKLQQVLDAVRARKT